MLVATSSFFPLEYGVLDYLSKVFTLDRQEGSRSHSERGQFLCESVTVGAVETSTHVGEQLVQGFVQLDLILRRLSAE